MARLPSYPALFIALLPLCALTTISSAMAQLPASNPSAVHQTRRDTNDMWWKRAVIYEIYPRSFQDSNGDGIGDLNGITQRLDYLRDLGVDAIWITPMYPSPQVDFGYDIADYTAIDPQYGTMADFERLVKEAKTRDIRVIMDLVPNHTSDKHPWFVESSSSRTNPKRDWYIWRDGKGPGLPPNNWQSWFGHSAWKFDARTGQFYYHHFYTEQPDLNWRNPEVRKAMYNVMRFWLDRGVSGFRLDAVSRLFEDPNLHDDPLLPGTNAYGDQNIEHKYTDNLAEVHEVLKEMRQVVDEYPGNPVLISETEEPNIAELTKLYGSKLDEIQLPMDFQVADVNQLSAARFRELIDQVENNPASGQPYFFFNNHDQDRTWDRYGDGVHNDAIARLLASLLLTTRATPQLYYGEEIGMVTTPPARKEDVRDPIGKLGWPKEKGRDGERTPMQWDTSINAGFTASLAPWLPVPPSYKQRNVAVEEKDPGSLLNFYKQLIRLRRTSPALRDGAQITVNCRDTDVLSYVRKHPNDGESLLVLLNMSNKPKTVAFNLKSQGITGDFAKPLLSYPQTNGTEIQLNAISLPPFGTLIATVK
ncbi:MAG TPA: alpha-glucosidase [Candidatus Limnocylindrales bacterium]|nr:alpha-glucosidase [Candidatus Limnocylindrales bacterium]